MTLYDGLSAVAKPIDTTPRREGFREELNPSYAKGAACFQTTPLLLR
ncbi:hypothetical protein BH11PSE4_BH11PSE4_40360 [soil metagenome]